MAAAGRQKPSGPGRGVPGLPLRRVGNSPPSKEQQPPRRKEEQREDARWDGSNMAQLSAMRESWGPGTTGMGSSGRVAPSPSVVHVSFHAAPVIALQAGTQGH